MRKFNKNNPFKIPKAYFEGFNDRLMNHISKEKSSIPKKDGFSVPENYFDTLHSNIIDKIDSDTTKVIPLNSCGVSVLLLPKTRLPPYHKTVITTETPKNSLKGEASPLRCKTLIIIFLNLEAVSYTHLTLPTTPYV